MNSKKNIKFLNVVLTNMVMPIGKLSIEDVNWQKESACFVGTMPRSGTNLILYFIDFVHQAILGELDERNPTMHDFVHAGWKGALQESLDNHFFLVSHNYCPGFESSYRGEFRDRWDGIFLEQNIDFVNNRGVIDSFKNVLYPNLNPKVKIIYVYRNPLDQIKSLSRHMKNNIRPYKTDIENFSTLYYYAQAYVKMHFSYVSMKACYEKNITFIKYEDIIRSNYLMLKRIAQLVASDDFPLNDDLVNRVIELCKPENMKEIEKKQRATLAGDQKQGTNESHIRSEGLHNWKSAFTIEQIHFIESCFRRFDMSLNDFDIGESINFDSNLLENNKSFLADLEEDEKQKEYFTQKGSTNLIEKQGPAIVKTYNKYNILSYNKKFYALLQALGPIDLEKDALSRKDLPPYIFVGDTPESLINRIDAEADSRVRITQLETELANRDARQNLLSNEVTRANAQLELIKDLLLREKYAL